MTTLRTGHSNLLAPGLREVFFNKFDEYPLQMEQVYNMEKTGNAYETDSYTSGFGLIPKKLEGVASAYDDPLKGLDTTYTPDTYSLAYRVTKEMREDDRYRIIAKMPASLGRSMRITIDTDGFLMFNRAETGGYVGADGKTLLATDHVLLNGGSQKNRLTNAADLTMDSLEQALIDISETVDDRGLPMHLMPKKLMVAKKVNGMPKES